MYKKWPQKPKKCRLNHIHMKNIITLEKYLKLFLKNLIQKLINFEAFYVGKVPKSSVFNQECLEISENLNCKNHENQKRVK